MFGSGIAGCLSKTIIIAMLVLTGAGVTGAGKARSETVTLLSFTENTTLLSRLSSDETLYPVSMKVSSDNAHIAYAARNKHGMFAVMDDRRGAYCDSLAKGTPVIGNGQKHWAYIAYQGRKKAQVVVDGRPEPFFDGIDVLVFSPDGDRWAYRAGIGGRQAVVVNGVAESPYDIIIPTSGPLFSPDGKRLAYSALNGKDGFLVVDGKALDVGGTIESIVFSPDSKRLAYVFKKDNQRRVVCDNQTGPAFDEVAQLTFSPDARRLVYMARSANRWSAVLDGRELPGGESVGMPLFSADSRHLAYATHQGKTWSMVTDGRNGPGFIKVGVYLFSPDSTRLAYMAQTEKGACMVVDDQAGPLYDSVGMPVFSPDSKQLAYRAAKDGKWFIMQDGRPHAGRYDGLRRPVFSPDGRRLAYVAIEGKEMVMVADERPLGRYDSVTFPFFSPQGTHVAYAGCLQDQWHIHVDGTPGSNVFDAFLKDGEITFDAENRCHAVVLKMPGPQFLLLDIAITAAPSVQSPK